MNRTLKLAMLALALLIAIAALSPAVLAQKYAEEPQPPRGIELTDRANEISRARSAAKPAARRMIRHTKLHSDEHAYFAALAPHYETLYSNHDGDTFKQGSVISRLKGLDAPELEYSPRWKDQPHGQEAKYALGQYLFYYAGEHTPYARDFYGRLIETVALNPAGRAAFAKIIPPGVPLDITAAMISQGHAWSLERKYKPAEERARRLGIGIWSHACQIPPKQWRAGKTCK